MSAFKELTGIDHPAIAVENLNEVANWYVDVLGYKVTSKPEGKGAYLLAAPDGTFLEVMPKDETTRPNRTTWTPGFSHLALRVTSLDAAIAYLDSKKVKWVSDIVPAVGGGKLRSFEDPEGNMLQVVER